MSRVCCRALASIIGAWAAMGVLSAGAQAVSTPAIEARPSRPVDDFRRVAIRYRYDKVSDVDPWHDLSAELAQRFPFGSVIAGVNTARRYGKTGAQFELQAYPHLGPRAYLALGGAWSGSSDVFLPLRLSAEPYYNFPSGWETSAGVRYLRSSVAGALTYTGTLARYFGNYWISGRPSFTRVSGTNSYGWELTGRRYFSERYDYLTLVVSRSVGLDPETRDPLRFTRPARLGVFHSRVERRQPLGGSHLRATYGAGYEREQIAPGMTRTHRTGTLGIEWYIR